MTPVNEGLIGVLAGTLTSLAIKGVDLRLNSMRARVDDSAHDRDRLSADIWSLLKELRNDYDRLDAELESERGARKKAEEEVKALNIHVTELQEQVRCQEEKTEKYKSLADQRLGKMRTLAEAVTKLQARVNGLETGHAAPLESDDGEDLLDATLFDVQDGE